jgi:hypothetical protein
MSFIFVFVSKRILTAGGGEDDNDGNDDLLATLEFVFAAGILNAREGDITTIPMLIVIVVTTKKKIITDTLNIIFMRDFPIDFLILFCNYV